jgi:hypothetical protein
MMRPIKSAGPGKTLSYQAPQLTVYGGMAQLTAAGTGATNENLCFNNPMGMKATDMSKAVRC